MYAAELTARERQVLREEDEDFQLAPDPPICKVWDWEVIHVPINRGFGTHLPPFIMAQRFQDHPTLGTRMEAVRGRELMTTTLRWFNFELGLARTENTLYKLM